MEYFNNILCITGGELIASDENPSGVMSFDCYKMLCRRKKINVLRRACYGTPALVEYDSLPGRYRQAWEAKNGDPRETAKSQLFVDKIETDPAAVAFYMDYRLTDDQPLKDHIQQQYSNEAAILNAIHATLNDRAALRKALGGSVRMGEMWQSMAETIHEDAVQKRFPHRLPRTGITLKRKSDKYQKEGYAGLIHSGFGNDNSRKVSAMLERLILSLYTAPNKPFGATVYDTYNLFVNGKIEVYDKKTGELFNRADFMKNGKPLELSESTVWNYINNPKNRIVVDEVRNDASFNSMKHRPFHRRKSPVFAFSKISMDDRDLTRKMHNGNRVKAYYAYDVTSGCVIGKAYSKTKDEALFIDCLRDMFRTIEANGFGMPLEVEVEHHLVNKFFDDLAQMFPYLRICAAGNSREKRAEHSNRAKKYGAEKKLNQPTGRWWARSEPYYQPTSKVHDEYIEPTGDYDRIVSDDLTAIAVYNNEKHPNQKKYPGLTRWQVLCDNLNPDLPDLSKAVLYKYIGHCTQTSVRASKEVTVQYAQYQLPHVSVMSKLAPNNLKVQAYYLPDGDGVIPEVYLYQGDTFIGACKRIDPYNEAQGERTAEDTASLQAQSAYDAQYRAMVKAGKADLAKTDTIEPEQLEAIKNIEVTEVPAAPAKSDAWDIDSLLNSFDPEAVRKSAITNL